MNNNYEVKSPLWGKIFIVAGYVALCVVITFDSEFSFVNLWKTVDIIGIIGFIFFFLVFPLIILIVLFTKTVFTKTEIIHTNFILMKTRKKYEDIENIEITRHSDARLHFLDGTSIKILTGQNQLSKMLQVVETNINLNLKQ